MTLDMEGIISVWVFDLTDPRVSAVTDTQLTGPSSCWVKVRNGGMTAKLFQ